MTEQLDQPTRYCARCSRVNYNDGATCASCREYDTANQPELPLATPAGVGR